MILKIQKLLLSELTIQYQKVKVILKLKLKAKLKLMYKLTCPFL